MIDPLSTDAPAEAALVSEYEVFARLPEWVLDAPISDRAVRLFAVLLRHADRGGRAFPSRSRLAERLRCSTDSVDRALVELRDLGALGVERNGGKPGQAWRPNTYRLRRRPDTESAPSRTRAASPSRTAAASLAAPVRNEREPVEREKTYPSPSTDVEAAPAELVLVDEPPTDGVFDDWWSTYPRRVGKVDARKAWDRARRRGVPVERLLDGARRYRDDPNREEAYTAHPSTWLNQGRYDDEVGLPARPGSSRAAAGDDLLRQAMIDAQAAEERTARGELRT